MAWADNKDYIISQVTAGTATPEQQAWYDRWVFSGSPETKDGMMTQAEMDAAQTTQSGGGLTFGGDGTTSTTSTTTSSTQSLLDALRAAGNTQAQQQEQAASNYYGFSDAQQGMYDDLMDRGRVDANGNLITDGLSRQQLYDLYTGGFGLGDTDAHRQLKNQAYEAWKAIGRPEGQITLDGSGDGLTFGGGSYVEGGTQFQPDGTPANTDPPPVAPPGQPPEPPLEPPVEPPIVQPPPVDGPPEYPVVEWDDPYQGVGPNGPLDNPDNPPPGYGGGYDWNWADFQPGAPSMDGGGGYDPNDYAFDRYVPGQESPWGIPEVEGGNKDFYRNQFVNLLRDEQNFRDRQRQADDIRQGADPLEATPMDWSWLEGGLPEVAVGGQEDWRLNESLAGMNNFDVLQQLRSQGDISKTTYDWFRDTWNNNDFDASGTSWWTNYATRDNIFSKGDGPAGQAAYQDLADGLFTNYGSPEGVAEGYAAPVQGYNPRRLGSGPAQSYFSPVSGTWNGFRAGG